MGGDKKYKNAKLYYVKSDGTRVHVKTLSAKQTETQKRIRQLDYMRIGLKKTTPDKFLTAINIAKNNQDKGKAWRVQPHDEYSGKDKLFITKGGSTIAVTEDGDIISVCKNKGDKTFASELLQIAVNQGGVKLDSYIGNHDFYTKNGFEPVSWCEWDDEYKPPDWNENRDKREPIIFYRYVGHPVTETAQQFMSRVPPSRGIDPKTGKPDNYSAAFDARDSKIKK